MKVDEILVEGINLDHTKGYGSWIHPKKTDAVYAPKEHESIARKILQSLNRMPAETDQKSLYKTMFSLGFVRVVHANPFHGNIVKFSGEPNSVKAVLSKMPHLRTSVDEIGIDNQDCSGPMCFNISTGRYQMPRQWRDALQS